MLIISCPGSGKTTTLLRRIRNMIRRGVRPSEILMVTFTNAAAGEMRDRYAALYGRESSPHGRPLRDHRPSFGA